MSNDKALAERLDALEERLDALSDHARASTESSVAIGRLIGRFQARLAALETAREGR